MSTKFFAQNIHFLVNNKVLGTLVPLPLTRLTALMSMFLSFCIQKYKVFGNLPVFLIRRRPTTFFFFIITTTNLSIWFVASFFWYKSLLFLSAQILLYSWKHITNDLILNSFSLTIRPPKTLHDDDVKCFFLYMKYILPKFLRLKYYK